MDGEWGESKLSLSELLSADTWPMREVESLLDGLEAPGSVPAGNRGATSAGISCLISNSIPHFLPYPIES